VIIGIVALLLCIELCGCNQISNIFLTDEDKLVGTWSSEGIWLDGPTVLEFFSNGTFKLEIEMGLPLPIDFSSSKGKWDMNDGILTMEIVDLIPSANYTYHFSEDSRTITITDIDTSDSYLLTKQ
jgi:hypothetical protein